MDFEQRWRGTLERQAEAGRLRSLRPVERLAEGRLRIADGRKLIDFASNDYLGLSHHPVLIERAAEWGRRLGVGSGASRLVTGSLAAGHGIEAKLAKAKGAEAALILVSGFQANSTLLPALLDKQLDGGQPVVLADRLIHASMIQGILAAGLVPRRFRHNDLDHLARLLDEAGDKPKLIVTETVFSMDGDRPDLPALVALAKAHGAFLYLDEAHATGLFGLDGFGLAHGLAGPDCLVMGTFGKALGSFGAYVACSATLRDYLINRCAGLVFATALPPPVLGAIDAAIDLLPEQGEARARVQDHAERFRQAARALGLDCGESSTQIVPLILGSEARALAAARLLEERGILAVAIRPPTVPAGTSRVRFTFSAAHDQADIDRLIALLPELAALPA